MNDMLGDLPYALVIMGDMPFFSATIPEHHRHLHEVLQRLCARKLYAAPSKCEYFHTASEYLGHVVSPNGPLPAPSLRGSEGGPHQRNGPHLPRCHQAFRH
jgi:hypothetical protein